MTLLDPQIAVVKVGGSLLDWCELPARLLSYLETHVRARLALIAGGGRVVDVIRALDRSHGLDPSAAHELALHAMDLTSQILHALVPELEVVVDLERLQSVWQAGQVPVVAPRLFLEADERAAADPLPRSWDVTSDSIAARLAERLHARELVLLKSASPQPGLSFEEMAAVGLVDRAFPEIARALQRVVIINLRSPQDAVVLERGGRARAWSGS